MYLRKIAAQKSELSFDEPLNTDWDGNELLLSDVLGTESDLVMRPIEADVDRQLLRQALERLEPREKQIITLPPRRRWPTSWASPSPTSPGWRSGSSPG